MMGSVRMQMPSAAACSHRSSVLRAAPLRASFTKAFLGAPSMLSSSRSYLTGTSLSTGCQQLTPGRRGMVVEANSKTGIGLTKRGTRRARTRTSGFRARMQTPSGRAVIKARRKKGRHTLCTASNYRK